MVGKATDSIRKLAENMRKGASLTLREIMKGHIYTLEKSKSITLEVEVVQGNELLEKLKTSIKGSKADDEHITDELNSILTILIDPNLGGLIQLDDALRLFESMGITE